MEVVDDHSGVWTISYILWDEGTQVQPNLTIISEDKMEAKQLEVVSDVLN